MLINFMCYVCSVALPQILTGYVRFRCDYYYCIDIMFNETRMTQMRSIETNRTGTFGLHCIRERSRMDAVMPSIMKLRNSLRIQITAFVLQFVLIFVGRENCQLSNGLRRWRQLTKNSAQYWRKVRVCDACFPINWSFHLILNQSEQSTYTWLAMKNLDTKYDSFRRSLSSFSSSPSSLVTVRCTLHMYRESCSVWYMHLHMFCFFSFRAEQKAKWLGSFHFWCLDRFVDARLFLVIMFTPLSWRLNQNMCARTSFKTKSRRARECKREGEKFSLVIAIMYYCIVER